MQYINSTIKNTFGKFNHIVFWQPIVTPHMFYLTKSLALKGHKVTYISSETLSADRTNQGWAIPTDYDGVLDVKRGIHDLKALFNNFDHNTIHLTSGISAQILPKHLGKYIRATKGTWGGMVETIDERFGLSLLKKIKYQLLLYKQDTCPDFILTIGKDTFQWFADRGYKKDKIFKFTYFLNDNRAQRISLPIYSKPIQIAYFGQLIHRKNVAGLIQALKPLSTYDFALNIYGSGPEKNRLINLVNLGTLKNKVFWHGTINMDYVPYEMGKQSVLVLPSHHDGWGAVVTEALMSGIPVICSSSCGAAEAVENSQNGGVFTARNLDELTKLLKLQFDKGALTNNDSAKLANWATCFNADSGAEYLLNIFDHLFNHGARPIAPWEVKK